jgi:glutathione S-transferase
MAEREARPMTEKLVLHEYALSGNCYKVRLTAAHVGSPIERREYDIVKGETRTPEFLGGVNPNGRIPVLQVGDRFIPESNAACYFLADGSQLVPEGPFDRADMLRWMFWEQYSHEPNIATLRLWLHFLGVETLSGMQREQIAGKRKAGDEALKLMDGHLAGREWFVGDAMTLADVCLFAYTHVADEGGFDLTLYPNVIAWMERIMLHPGHVQMDA